MGKVCEIIDGRLANWLQQQQMYFVATAPLSVPLPLRFLFASQP
jgi:hypothetical protein